MLLLQLFVSLGAVSPALSHPVRQNREFKIVTRTESVKYQPREALSTDAAFNLLKSGNQAFKDNVAANDPTLLKTLTDDGQEPPFMFLGCSDSRVSEGTVFNAKPGTLFTQRNIANQFHSTDANSHSVLSYAVSELGVNHIIVMGHYGCGGVAAAIASPPTALIDVASGSVQNWIDPIRSLFQSSSRAEIVELRDRLGNSTTIEEPEAREPGFRALVEENIKASVRRIAADSVISNHFALLSAGASSGLTERRSEGELATDVFIHGWVYDIETGEVKDLGVSVGPPGKDIPTAPFPAVANAAESTANKEGASESSTQIQERCQQLCQAKRSLFARMPSW